MGRWTYHKKKHTVEDCWTISISQITRSASLQDPPSAPKSFRPTVPKTGKRMSPVRCMLETGDSSTPLLMLSYSIPSKWGFDYEIEQEVHLQTTRPHFGGVRWWFSCPHKVNGTECRRVGKLYRLPEERYFACRHCLDLSYRSSQEAHKYDRLCARIAGEDSGEVFRAVKEGFTPQKRIPSGREAGGTPTLLRAFDKVFGEAEGK